MNADSRALAPQDGVGTLLEGVSNFRDLGGLPVSGGRVAPGLVFRSEALAMLTENGTAALERLGIRLVCDLRTLQERRKEATAWRGRPPRVLAVDEGIDLYGSSEAHIRKMYGDETGQGARDLVTTWYADLHRAYEPVVRELFAAVADRHEVPVLIHCSAGKDRTGFVTSMLLLALGATRAVVEADYLRTDSFFGADRLSAAVQARIGRAPSAQVVDALRVNVDYLGTSFAAIESDFGSIDDYLHHVGLDDTRRHHLRDVLVEAEG
jgi:protein-tyrosine phosphatase